MLWDTLYSFGGAALDYFGNKAENQANRDAQAQANSANMGMAERNIDLQREFARNGIRWRVEDAKAAGIHPLAALGAQTQSFNPVSVGQEALPSNGGQAFKSLSRMGQDMTRAASKMQTAQEREMTTLQMQSAKLDIEGKALDNQIRAAQLAKTQSGPAMAGTDNFMPGQGNSNLVKVKPSERVVSAPGKPGQEAGWVTDVGYVRTGTGLAPVPSKDAKERIEDQIIPEVMWAARNQLLPNFDQQTTKPSANMLPKGATDWKWNYNRQEWRPVYGKKDIPFGGYGPQRDFKKEMAPSRSKGYPVYKR